MPVRLVSGLIAFAPVAALRGRRNRNRIERHHATLPKPVPEPWRPLLAELANVGLAQTTLTNFGLTGSDAMVQTAQRLIRRHADGLEAQARAGVPFLIVPPVEIMTCPELYRFGLNETILDIVEAYLGQSIAYDGVSIHYTPADDRAVSTRAWHRDREDRRMVKLGIYLNDVDGDGGPFQLLAGLDADRLADDCFLLPPEQAAGQDVISCEGPTGTMIFADTARYFHRGKPATGRSRGAIFFSYFTAHPRSPFFCDRSGLTRTQTRALAHDLSTRQRDAALWHDRLPFWWRLIPSEPL